MTIDVTPVLIVGGGIAGPATARMLRRSGLDARVVERAPAGGGAGVYLPAKSVRALGELGLAVGRRSGRRSVLGATRHLPHAASDGVHPLAARRPDAPDAVVWCGARCPLRTEVAVTRLELRLARAARLIREAADDERDGEVPPALLDGLAEVVPGVCVQFSEMEPRTQRTLWSQSTDADRPHDWTDPAWDAVFWRVYPEIAPLRYICDGNLKPEDVLRLSDFIPHRVLVGTALYQDYMRPHRERYAMGVPLPTVPGRVRGFFFFRWDRDFAESDRDLLVLLRPHLQAIYRARQRRRAGIPELTPRQWQVLRCLARGGSTEQVAAALCVNTCTVRKHLENIYVRLGVSSRAAAIGAAMLGSRAVATGSARDHLPDRGYQ